MKNYRWVDCHCCADCKYYEKIYEDTYCNHPNNKDTLDNDKIYQPNGANVCDEWEKKKDACIVCGHELDMYGNCSFCEAQEQEI